MPFRLASHSIQSSQIAVPTRVETTTIAASAASDAVSGTFTVVPYMPVASSRNAAMLLSVW